ncbi:MULTISPECIES: DNA translocase FtsK [Mesorhizobium]|uniref:DNA translocase FtsK n=1 Tax=Mesorhizobium denitrificans TaxID=2294114 RepID=A0A371XGK1_9HYPH|nr:MULTISPECIES: DNA translocase FtsK [Mesorhizobium]RFC68360.1 DNA translocase FtsK [Mesorhizobium denitrificans]
MRSGSSSSMALEDQGFGFRSFLKRQAGRVAGLALLMVIAFCLAAMATWNVADPSFSHATGNEVTNAMGYPGAVFSDLAIQFYGLSSVAALVPAVIWALFLATATRIDRVGKRALAWFGASVLFAGIAGCFTPPPTWPLPTGLGGVFGDMVLKLPSLFIGAYPSGWKGAIVALVLLMPALVAFSYASAIIARGPEPKQEKKAELPMRHAGQPAMEDGDEDEDDGFSFAFLGAVTHWWLSAQHFFRRRFASHAQPGDFERRGGWRRAAEQVELAEMEEMRVSPHGRARVEPEFFAQMVSERRVEPQVFADDDDMDDAPPFDMDDDYEVPLPSPDARVQNYRSVPGQTSGRPSDSARVSTPAPRPQQGNRVVREAQTSMLGSGTFEMPSLHFLAEPKNVVKHPSLSKDALEQNARLLEGVLEDFGVKGEIIQVRPGPVVTLYELEPAPGIKSSRVIGLADDIARSMSAIACRVAVVPGRNAIGIELPNASRETVYLRELLASRDFEQTKAKLALALGKTINGEAVTVDIAKMPHVLVAGTTGSGKSVAINTMILSMLYRMTPEECRLIMIDPKMLELSVYDGIPHLLTPVVTDPKKAVVALKWTVREMEDRYRKMSKVGVRNIDGFNARVAQAEKSGEQISRTVQTGFDRQTGEAIYETEVLDLKPMPYIVVIIDEMADLMMVAGKDIEGAVQRLAQMARAAGIHVIMATQRPSVDVITGTIKANFPTRISFQVTSKIDSRTILGEQGAEQLLGMGDMLYMAGGGRIQRVHGPFVSDDEVEKVVKHLKTQGVPEYLDAITEDDEDDEDDQPRGGGGGGGGNFDDSEDPYDQAVSVVLRDGKASTSYIQRRLGVGYNKAASIIERMEQEGIVGPANHAGKREILVPTEQDKM